MSDVNLLFNMSVPVNSLLCCLHRGCFFGLVLFVYWGGFCFVLVLLRLQSIATNGAEFANS